MARSRTGRLLLHVLPLLCLVVASASAVAADVDVGGVDSVARVLRVCKAESTAGDEAQCIARRLYSARMADLLHKIAVRLSTNGLASPNTKPINLKS